MKQHYYLIIILVLIGLMGGIYYLNLQTPNKTSNTEPMMVKIPGEYVTYQNYLSTIHGHYGISDSAMIEATILSINKERICPYKRERVTKGTSCSIEPYPSHYGKIRIDKIINYTSYSEETSEQPLEKPQEGETETKSDFEGVESPSYKGQEPPNPKKPTYQKMEENQNISTKFLLTVDPAIAKTVTTESQDSNVQNLRESSGGDAQKEDYGKAVTHNISGGEEEKSYKPIPREDGRWVFTNEINSPPAENYLPGLEEGDKFRAKVKYNGKVYLEEYQKIK